MAKGDLHAVIRLNKLEIDDLRRQLGEAQRLEADLVERDRQLDAALEREARMVDSHPETGFTFPGYLQAHRRRKEALAAEIEAVRTRIAEMREALMALYRTRKTYELAQEARDARAAAELARKDQAVLDEVGLTMHRRRRSEDAEDDPASGI